MSDDKEMNEFQLSDEEVEAFFAEADAEEPDEEEEDRHLETEEPSIRMVETEEDVIVMVDEPVENNRETSEKVAQRMAGQTHAKFKQVRKEKSALKMKYMGKARRY
jgi:hypothetical protein